MELRLARILYPWHFIKFVNNAPAWKQCISLENPVKTDKNWENSYILSGSKVFMSAAWTHLCLCQCMAKRQSATWDFYTFQVPSAMNTHTLIFVATSLLLIQNGKEKKIKKKRRRIAETVQEKRQQRGKMQGRKEP